MKRRPSIRHFLSNDGVAAIHTLLASFMFAPFFLWGRVFLSSTDALNINFPMLFLAKRAFLAGYINLWNPYVLNGAPTTGYALSPELSIENWPLFLVHERWFFFAAAVVQFVKLALVGICAFHLFRRELGNRRWALVASITYQLCGWLIWAATGFDVLSMVLYFTIALYLVWTLENRRPPLNYILLSVVFTLLLFSSNLLYCAYAMVTVAIFSLYRLSVLSAPWRSKIGDLMLLGLSGITASTVFLYRIIPLYVDLHASVRSAPCCGPEFNIPPIFGLRLAVPEIFGIFDDTSSQLLGSLKGLKDYHIDSNAPHFFGVIALLLVLFALASHKKPKERFWAVVLIVFGSIATYLLPFQVIGYYFFTPFYHNLAVANMLPLPFCMMVAIGGRAVERRLHAGTISSRTLEFLSIAFAGILFLALAILERYEAPAPGDVTPYRFIALGVALILIAAVLLWHKAPRLYWRAMFGLVVAIAITIMVWIGLTVGTNKTNEFFATKLGISLLALSFIAGIATLYAGWPDRFALAKFDRKKTYVAASVLGVIAILVLVAPIEHAVRILPSHDQAIQMAWVGVARFVLVCIIFFAAICSPWTRKLSAAAFLSLTILVLCVEQVPNQLVHSHKILNPFYSRLNPYDRYPLPTEGRSNSLRPDNKNYRVNYPVTSSRVAVYRTLYGPGNEICSSANALYGIRSYGGQYNIIPRQYARFIHNWHPKIPVGTCVYAIEHDNRFLDLVGAGYTYNPAKLAYTRRETALARFMLFHSYEVLPTDEILSRLKSTAFDPLVSVILEKKPPFASASNVSQARRITYNSITSDHLTLSVDTKRTGLLFFDDTFDTGWHATVDGQPTQVYRANYDFMAIAVPAGRHEISFRFAPASVRYGTYAAIAGFALFFAVSAILILVFRRRKASRSGPAIPTIATVLHRYRWLCTLIAVFTVLTAIQAIRHQWFIKQTLAAQTPSISIKVVEPNYKRFNILQLGPDDYLAFPQEYGPFSAKRYFAHGYPKAIEGQSIEIVKRKADAEWARNFPIKLIEQGYKGFNILQIGPSRYLAFPQSYGAYSRKTFDAHGYPKAIEGTSLPSVKKLADAAFERNFTVKLIEQGYKGFNILHIGPKKYLALGQGEGAYDPKKLDAGKYTAAFVGPSIEDVKKQVDRNHTAKGTSLPSVKSAVKLIEEGYKGFNILQIGPEKFLALGQSEGAYDPKKLAAGQYKAAFVGSSIEEVKKQVDRNRATK